MKRMKLNLCRMKNRNYQIFIDGALQKPVKSSFGQEIIFTTEKNEIEVVIYNTLHLRSPFWFVISAVLYFISFFGVFDFGNWRDCIFSYCKLRVPVADGEVLTFAPFSRKKDMLAFQITGRIPLTVVDNTNYIDPIAKRRRLVLRLTHVFATLAALIIAVLIAINMIV